MVGQVSHQSLGRECRKLHDKCFNNFIGEVEGGRGKEMIKQDHGVLF